MNLEQKIEEKFIDYDFVCEILELKPPEPLKTYALQEKYKFSNKITNYYEKYKKLKGKSYTRP